MTSSLHVFSALWRYFKKAVVALTPHADLGFTNNTIIICTSVWTRSIKLGLPEFLKWPAQQSSAEMWHGTARSSAAAVVRLSWEKEAPWRVSRESAQAAASGHPNWLSQCWYFSWTANLHKACSSLLANYYYFARVKALGLQPTASCYQTNAF